jgi:hypothetical protein
MNLPFDAVLLKRKIANLLFRNHLHGRVTRKRSPDNSDKFCTEIIIRGQRNVVAKFTNSLNLVLINSGHSNFSVTAIVTHDDFNLDGVYVGKTGTFLYF